MTDKMNRPRRLRGLGFGILLIVIGAVLLGINFGYIPVAYRGIIFSWPALIVLVGIIQMFRRYQILWGAVTVVFGGFFLIPRIIRAFPDAFPGVGENFAAAYWPFLIILFGIVVILRKYVFPMNSWSKEYGGKYHHHHHYHYDSAEKKTGARQGFEKNSIFAGGEHIILDPEFTGGEVNSIFGGMTLDLRRTSLPEGETFLDVNAVFGGVTLYIPSDWYVETHIDAIFGGFEDKRLVQEPLDRSRKLVLTGACVFGGGEIMG